MFRDGRGETISEEKLQFFIWKLSFFHTLQNILYLQCKKHFDTDHNEPCHWLRSSGQFVAHDNQHQNSMCVCTGCSQPELSRSLAGETDRSSPLAVANILKIAVAVLYAGVCTGC